MTAPIASATIPARPGPAALATALGGEWARVDETELALQPTPLNQQPSAYVQRVWAGRGHGLAKGVNVAAATVSGRLLVRLRWKTATPHVTVADINQYPDACALLFPLDGQRAVLETMGSETRPVCGWYWRAGSAETFVVTARGLGTVERLAGHELDVDSELIAGEWQVRFSSPLGGSHPPAGAATTLPFGVAVWTGSGEERAGIKAHTPAWHMLAIAAEEKD